MRTVIFCAVSFVVGFAALYLILLALSGRRRKAKRAANRQGADAEPKKGFLARFGTMNLILVIVAVLLVAFTCKMIGIFEEKGAIPDTLVTCVFGVCGGECGIMGWIKTNKERNRDRKWQKEDEQEMRSSAKAVASPLPQEEDHPKNNL